MGALFYIPDCMKIRTLRAFPNRLERWRDNLESAKDFSPDEGWLSRYTPAHFFGGVVLFFSPIPQGMGNTKAPTEEKVGVVFIKAEPIDKARGKKTKKGLG